MLLIPAIMIAGIAARLLANEDDRVRRAATAAAERQLHFTAEQLGLKVSQAQASLVHELKGLSAIRLEEELRTLEKRHPLVRNVFVWTADRGLFVPDASLPLSDDQRGFIQRYSSLFQSGAWEEPSGRDEVSLESPRTIFSREVRYVDPWKSGWIPWFWENQLGLLGWVQQGDEQPRYGVEMEVMALLLDLLPVLPDDLPEGQSVGLLDGNGRLLHRTDRDVEAVALRMPVGKALPHWEVVLYTADGMVGGYGAGVKIISGMLVVILFAVLFGGGALLVREMHRMRRDAQQKTSFVANVSHELKTPLTTIRMYADLLSEGRVSDPEKTARYLKAMVRESHRLTRLVNNVLDFSRLEQHRKQYQLTTFDVREVVQETVDSQRARIGEAGMELSISLPENGAEIASDRDVVQQVLLNLMDNAVKYAAEGRRLSISLDWIDIGWEIRVADGGAGVPYQYRQRIFERFFRIDDSLTAQSQGCGLGLSISRRLLAGLGGTLEYEPGQPNGACFVVTLPSGERNA